MKFCDNKISRIFNDKAKNRAAVRTAVLLPKPALCKQKSILPEDALSVLCRCGACLRQHLFFDLLHQLAERTVGLDKIRYGLARVEHRGVVATSDGCTDSHKCSFGVFLGQIHRNLTNLCYVALALCRIESFGVDVLMCEYGADDVFERYLLLRVLNVCLQNVAGQRGCYLHAEERRVGYKRRESTLDLANVRRDVVSQITDHIIGQIHTDALCLCTDNLHLRVVVGHVDYGRQSPLEAGKQSLLDVLKFHGGLVRGQHQLFSRHLQMAEDVEECVLRSGLARQLLYVVDKQHVDHLIEVDEVGDRAVLHCGLILRLKLVHRDVEHLQIGMTLTDFVTYGLYDVGFAQTRIAIYVQRVERGVVARVYCHRHAGRAGQTVAFTLDEVVERVARVELRVDDYLAWYARNCERISYLCRVGGCCELSSARRVGVRTVGKLLLVGLWHCIVKPCLLSVVLRYYGLEEWQIVLFYLLDVACIGHTQTQCRTVEFERNDREKPLRELFL